MHKRHVLRATALALSTLVLGGLMHAQAQAQDFHPRKPVTLVVGFAAGGGRLGRA
jgi:tripartite-type tricarboxylate transporter receptor subunit TctC